MKINLVDLENFLKEVDGLFPVSISSKTDLNEYAKKLYNKADFCVFTENNKIISMAAGYIKNSESDIAYISLVATLPGYQGKGYGKRVVKEFIKKSKNSDMKGIHLYTVKSNTPAVSLYKSLGFNKKKFENESRENDLHLYLDI